MQKGLAELAGQSTSGQSQLEGPISRPGGGAPAGGGYRPTIWRRMLRVLRFDSSVYGEVARDPAGARQAAWVVAVAAAAAAVGTALATSWYPGAILGAVLAALLHWLLWSGLVYVIGTWVFGRRGSPGQLARGLGYAQAPQVVAVLGFLPIAGAWAVVAARLLTMLAGHHAIAATFGLSRRQTMPIVLVSAGLTLTAGALVRAWLGEVDFLTAVLRP